MGILDTGRNAYGIDDDGRQPPSHAPMLGSPVQAQPAVVGQKTISLEKQTPCAG
ncbi:hypothetical protein RA280_40940 [Cupriavidus sp. CV2]|uniref:hypothetical protein n=1 Tax=Cupriavidus ulmosensis TaxID=3065913 RepID=UPI00296AC0F8|nr:hypothetical protein [Cupriavidus sp. CV2]MDW3687988.1 hypothetical protein [Cupriavidus sp. CV2]